MGTPTLNLTLDQIEELLARRKAEEFQKAKTFDHLKNPINKTQERVPYKELDAAGDFVPAVYVKKDFPCMVYHVATSLDPNERQKVVHNQDDLDAAIKAGYSTTPIVPKAPRGAPEVPVAPPIPGVDEEVDEPESPTTLSKKEKAEVKAADKKAKAEAKAAAKKK